MFVQALRRILVPLSVVALAIGLAPPPAVSAAASSERAPLTRPAPATVESVAATEAVATPTLPAPVPPEPAGELLDVYAGIEDRRATVVPGAAGDQTSDPAVGVAAEVRVAVDSDGSVPVIVRLREQPDLVAVAQAAAQAAGAAMAATAREQGPAATRQVRDAGRAARGQAVVEALQATARDSQPAVRALLADHQAADVREFWIFNGFAATVDEATLDALAAHPDVASVSLDETVVLDEPVPDDTGEPLLPGWSLENVGAPGAWGDYGVRGSGVVVGVMDSGVDGDHPALAASWRGNTGDPEASWFVPTGENYPEPGDGHGHGTHVTGSIVGAPPGEVTGVAPDAQWIAAKIFRDSGATTDSIIHASFEWMLAPGGDPAAAPHVVNNSWGSPATHRTEYWDGVAAWVAAGIVPIFANGNDGPGTGTVSSPASYPHAIGVGATDVADRAAWFSSRGPVSWDGVEYAKPQLSAPGDRVHSSWPTHRPEGDYRTISGTSMAAPHVTGVVALLLSAAPDLTIDEVREALVTTARTTTHTEALPDAYGAGIVDAHAALTHVAHSGLVTGTVTDPDGAPVSATVTAAGLVTTADPETGGYALRLPAGSHELTATGYGYAGQTVAVTVAVGAVVTRDLTLTATAEQTLIGTVASIDGPVPDARVSLPGAPVPAARTDPEGRFTLTVAEGVYDLHASAGRYAPATVEVVVDGPTQVAVTLTAAGQPAAPGWAQYQNNPARTGRSGDSLAGATLQPGWTSSAGGDLLFSSPVIADGRVYANVDGGRLVALDLADGTPLWAFEGSQGMRGAPAVAGGVVYTGGGEAGGIHAVDAATGTLLWTVDTPGRRSIYTAPVVAGGVVYATTGFTTDRSDTVYALDAATGAEIWSVDIGTRAFFGPAVADGLVVTGSAGDRTLLALDAATGAPVWSLVRPDDEFIGGPAIADGTVYAATSMPPEGSEPGWRGSLLAVDAATGALRWEVPSHGDGQGTTPAVHGDLVIAGSHGQGVIGAYDRATGAPVWHYGLAVSGGVSASVLVSGDGYVVAGSQIDQRIFALDAATGAQVWEQPVGGNVLSSPAYADGWLVTGESNGTVRAFHPTGALAGTVTGPDGPLPATIHVRDAEREVEADPDTGAFEVTGLPPGDYTVEVRQFGFGTQTRTRTVRVAQTTTLDVALAPVGVGALTGAVHDEAGQGLPGATVTLSPTPLEPAVTDDDGGYAFDQVAAGTYQVVVDADGYARTEDTVTISDGQNTVADFTLARFDVAVVADHEGRISGVLAQAGWRVDQVSFAAIDGTIDRYAAVVLAGTAADRADADPDRFARIVADADTAGTSLVFVDTGGLSYGAIRTLSQVTGDPTEVAARLAARGPVWLEEVVPHPVTASLTGPRVPLLTSGSWHAWFSGYGGHTLATLGTDRDGRLGGGVGYQPRTLDSNHILLPAAAPSPWSDWQPVVADLLVDAVSHAAGAAYGAVEGTVAGGDGEPVPATVEVLDGLARTVAGEDGGYRLLLAPGEHTLRFRFLGAQTVELPVTVTAGDVLGHDVTLPRARLGTLAGQVRDQDTDRPVAGATVSVPGLDPVTTGPDGRYVLTEVAGGERRVEFSADGYETLIIHDVGVTDGEVTTLDVWLTRAPGVVVVGDRNDEITGFLEDHSIPAEQAGWEVVDNLAGVEVAILHNPPDLGRDEFLAALAAFDDAGVSVIFPADGWATRTRGVDLLVRHTGDPSGFGRLGGISGPEIFLHDLADHPVFDGIGGAGGDPVQLLAASSEAAYFPDYSGVVLAGVAAGDAEPAGIGVAYHARTPDSVHLLLTGLAATLRNSPGGNWTPDGQQIFLNAVRWAAAPGMGGLQGTVTDPAGQSLPHARVEVVGTAWSAVTGADGAFTIGVPPGSYTVEVSAFGYATAQRELTVAADQVVDASVQLAVADVGTIEGVVSSGEGGGTLAGARVDLRGTPHQTETGPDGSYQFRLVEPGSYELELETEGHVRTRVPVEVAAGATTASDVALRPSPLIGIIDDSDFSNSRDRAKEFLADWGYEVEDIGFDELDRIPALDLVVANVSDFTLELSAAELMAFEEAVNRAGVPVLWMGQHGRGAIQFLHEHHGDPAVTGQGFNDGTVTATVVEDHPLVAGLPDEFPLIVPDGRYTFFDEFDGSTVATLATGDGGELGATIAYRGRTAGTVDVLLSTLTATTWGAPSTRQAPALNWTPQAERVYLNAVAWALDAQGLGAEVRGTVVSDQDGPIPSRVEVVETGRSYAGRDGDGTFLVPLAPGSWTLEVSRFGHQPATVEVTVEAGDVASTPVTLTALPAGALAGTVTGPDGSPVAGAEVHLPSTPLAATTGAGGGYTVAGVPDGDWTLRVTADGFRAAQLPVTVTAGQVTAVDVQLRDTATVAIVDTTGASSHGVSLATMLAAEGYEVELVHRNDLLELAGRAGEHDLVIFNATLGSAQVDGFRAVVDAAAEAGVSTIFGSTFGSGYPIPQLSGYRGDPGGVDWGFVSVGVDYVPSAPHPIFAGFPVGEPIELITSTLSNLNQQWGSFSQWSGETIAQVHSRLDGEDLGGGVGYRFSSPTSVELLLGSLAASNHGWPDERWTRNARQIYLNAVAWALDATQAELTGVVTSGGTPLAGASVTAVEAATTAVTGPDGSYVLGLAEGSYTVRVEAFGFAPATREVAVPESGTVALDVELVPLPRGEVTGVVSSVDGDPVAGATVTGAGPLDWTATTGDDGRYLAGDLLEGAYQVTVTADGFLPATGMATVVADQTATLDITLQPTDVGVLGDADGALTAYLRTAGVPATELDWSAEPDLSPYQVVVVNGGDPDAATLEALLAAADDAEVSLVFTGTWAVDRGGIRLLERHTDRVVVGTQGYGDGPVQLAGFDPAHPLFAGLGGDPATLIVDGGYYSVLDSYVGTVLADLHVARDGDEPVTGAAVGWDWRTAGSVEVLLSASAATEAVGPGLGWTADGGRLLVNAIEWARDAQLEPPAAPTLAAEAQLALGETVTVTGTATATADQVTVLRDGAPVATVEVAADGSWSAEVPLAVGDNPLTAVASNAAGQSPPSAVVTVARWVPEWEVRGQWPVHAVTLRLDGPSVWTDPAQRAELVIRDAAGAEVARHELTWVNGFYLHTLRGLDPGDYTLHAELEVDGHLLVLDGPPL